MAEGTEVRPAMKPAWEPTAGMDPVRITDVKAICTAPEGVRLVVVKIETSDDGHAAPAGGGHRDRAVPAPVPARAQPG
jgi:hypothetical protein